MPNNIYNQATNLQAQGRFAPGVSYRADIRKPTQPVPDLPKAEASFNIDLRSIGQAMIENKNRELVADRASKTEQDKVLKNSYMNSLARELMLNETAVDQGQYDTLTGDRKARTIIDNYLANGAAYGVSADDISGIYPKYGASTFRATQDRLDWANNIREEEQKQYNDYVKAVPSAAELPYAQALYEAKLANQQSAEFASAMERINAEPDNEANQMMLNRVGVDYGYTQGTTTFSNIMTSLKNGQISSVNAKEQVRNSVMAAYMQHSGMDNTRAVNLTNMVMERLEPTIDRIGQMNKAEYETAELWQKKQGLKNRVTMDLLNPGYAALRDSGYPVNPDQVYLDVKFPEISYNRSKIRGTTTVIDGKTIVTPERAGNIESYTNVFGVEVPLPAGVESEQEAALYNAVAYERMPYSLDMATNLVIPKGNYLWSQVAADTRRVGNSSNINKNGVEFSRLSPEDRKIVLQNQENYLDATANNPIYREGLKNNNDTDTEQYIDFKARLNNGNKMIDEGRFKMYRWQDAVGYFGTEEKPAFIRKGLVQTEDGHLLLQDDIEGPDETAAQWFAGYEGKQHLQHLNNMLNATCSTAEERKDAIAAMFGEIPVWNGEEGYSTVPTPVETVGFYVGDISSKVVQEVKSELYKGGEAFGETVAKGQIKLKENAPAIKKAFITIKEKANDYFNKIISLYETGKNAYQLRRNAAGGLESMTNLPTFEERVEQLSPEDQEKFNKASKEQKEELKNRWNFYRLIRGIENSETEEDIQNVETGEVVNKESFVDNTMKYVKRGYPIPVAGGLALLQTLTPEKREEIAKNLKEMGDNETAKAVKEISQGTVDGIAEIIGAPGDTFAHLAIGTQYGFDEGYNMAAQKSALNAGIYMALYGTYKAGEYTVGKGTSVFIDLLDALGSPVQPIETRAQREQKARLKELTPIKINSADLERIELEENGYVLLGTESDEEIHEMYKEMKKGSN